MLQYRPFYAGKTVILYIEEVYINIVVDLQIQEYALWKFFLTIAWKHNIDVKLLSKSIIQYINIWYIELEKHSHGMLQ